MKERGERRGGRGRTREQAAYPVDSLRADKYWPPVNRVDNVYGDRNLYCACPAIDSWREEETEEA